MLSLMVSKAMRMQLIISKGPGNLNCTICCRFVAGFIF